MSWCCLGLGSPDSPWYHAAIRPMASAGARYVNPRGRSIATVTGAKLPRPTVFPATLRTPHSTVTSSVRSLPIHRLSPISSEVRATFVPEFTVLISSVRRDWEYRPPGLAWWTRRSGGVGADCKAVSWKLP
ncbi:hypothetical protein GCM10010431_57190 [Streptomyces kunmingensis]